MKRLALLLSLSLLLNGCKQNETTPKDEENEKIQPVITETDCSYFNPYDSLPTTEAKVRWLRENEANDCDSIYDQCRVNAHRISENDFNVAVKAYWGEKNVVYTGYTLAKIKNLSAFTKYQKFIAAGFGNDSIVKLTVTTNFTDNPACYSIPLFYSIARVENLDGKKQFIFTKAIVGGNETIVFFVKGTNHFYDMTNNPF